MFNESDWGHIIQIIQLFLPVLTLYAHHKWCAPGYHERAAAAAKVAAEKSDVVRGASPAPINTAR